ncbi:unnamed protein product [Penicillium roqueforti FM164]|uniref:Genomic scaffold, ProqFM164S02 n=1 Tax=Penicillium roqueforti (strain FM164) TaxID=1365484 RepID=W6Q9K9_PENRF|nr:unnamed protein product [Penicillium roqueforti FM164]
MILKAAFFTGYGKMVSEPENGVRLGDIPGPREKPRDSWPSGSSPHSLPADGVKSQL